LYIFKREKEEKKRTRIHTVGKPKVGNPSLFPVDKHPSLASQNNKKED
jgi:hypothetical protein